MHECRFHISTRRKTYTAEVDGDGPLHRIGGRGLLILEIETGRGRTALRFPGCGRNRCQLLLRSGLSRRVRFCGGLLSLLPRLLTIQLLREPLNLQLLGCESIFQSLHIGSRDRWRRR